MKLAILASAAIIALVVALQPATAVGVGWAAAVESRTSRSRPPSQSVDASCLPTTVIVSMCLPSASATVPSGRGGSTPRAAAYPSNGAPSGRPSSASCTTPKLGPFTNAAEMP